MGTPLRDLVFATGLALLASHELDAVAHSEWHLLPLLRRLDDPSGFVVFVALHVPLFAAIFWLTGSLEPAVRRRSQLGVDLFLVTHGGLHLWFSGEAAYSFDSLLSNSLIFGAAAVGAIHFALAQRSGSP